MNFLWGISSVSFLCCFLVYSVNAQTDNTLVPGAKGKDVAEAVVRKIKRSAIFGEDSDFTRRVAWVESSFGDDTKTYRDGYYGGIWQVDEDFYNRTLNVQLYPRLIPLHASILSLFRFNWATTTWESLRTPLYSGLAFRLFINGVLGLTIPGTTATQGTFWKARYNRNNSLTEQHFRNLIRELEAEPICRGRMDICVILDGSGSVGSTNFETSKVFVANLVNTFDIGNDSVKTGFVEYSDIARTIFPVENSFDKATLDRKIREIPYLQGGTNTSGGILTAVGHLRSVNPRPGVPAVMTVLTDGESNIDNLTAAVQVAKRNEIYSFAVGIGSGAVRKELLEIAYGDPTHVFESTSFEALSEFFYRLNTETCTTPQKPETNETVVDKLIKGERRYYLYKLPAAGLTIEVTLKSGSTQAYFSYTEEVPSSAMNDGKSDGSRPFYIPRGSSSSGAASVSQNARFFEFVLAGESAYITIEGVEALNEYTMITKEGDHSSSTKVVISLTLMIMALLVPSLV